MYASKLWGSNGTIAAEAFGGVDNQPESEKRFLPCEVIEADDMWKKNEGWAGRGNDPGTLSATQSVVRIAALRLDLVNFREYWHPSYQRLILASWLRPDRRNQAWSKVLDRRDCAAACSLHKLSVWKLLNIDSMPNERVSVRSRPQVWLSHVLGIMSGG